MHPLFTTRRTTDYIVVHCSASPPKVDVGAKEIRQWHRAKGWVDIGYHKVIRRDGRVEDGRPIDVVGAHVENHNSNSVGICLVGGIDDKGRPEDNFTRSQFHSLALLLTELRTKYPNAEILGHRDFPGVKKACPSFDVRSWLKTVPAVDDVVDVLPADTRAIEVTRGMTVWSIAKTYGYSVQEILDENPHLDPKNLKIGQLVKLPG